MRIFHLHVMVKKINQSKMINFQAHIYKNMGQRECITILFFLNARSIVNKVYAFVNSKLAYFDLLQITCYSGFLYE